jgi:hypothetical protein
MASLLKRNMRLFGIPYQFLPSVDPRIPTVSETVGRKFAENIILDAPVITIMPGKPKFLPSAKDKQTTAQAIIDASSDFTEPLKKIIDKDTSSGDVFKYYDFEASYREYIQYVNILCRTCASFLEIRETIDGKSCQRYDYSNYKWNTDSISGSSIMGKVSNRLMTSLKSAIANAIPGIQIDVSVSNTNVSDSSNEMQYTTSSKLADYVEDLLTNYNYVQFFIDATSTDETMTNNVSESKIKGMLDSGSDMLKEIAFLVNSGGFDSDALTDFAESSTQALADTVGGISDSSAVTGALSRILSLSSNIAKGENIIMPDIYQNSSYDKSYSFTVHLKTPYGTKFGYFMDICVPLMHLLALGIPKQTSANTYGSPFLIKAYCEGMFTCNLGMVTSITVSKGLNSSFSVDGLPTEVDVTVTISDLYSDLSMSPQSSPLLFINNSSLVDYLATTCGLSLITPNLQSRIDMITDAVVGSFADIGTNIVSSISEAVDNKVKEFLGLILW